MPGATLSKTQRLKSRSQLQLVFEKGRSIYSGNIRMVYYMLPGNGLVQCGVGANKKLFRRAVDRNRVKRLLRESYRLQQAIVSTAALEKNSNLWIFIMYRNNVLPEYSAVYAHTGICLQKLAGILYESIA